MPCQRGAPGQLAHRRRIAIPADRNQPAHRVVRRQPHAVASRTPCRQFWVHLCISHTLPESVFRIAATPRPRLRIHIARVQLPPYPDDLRLPDDSVCAAGPDQNRERRSKSVSLDKDSTPRPHCRNRHWRLMPRVLPAPARVAKSDPAGCDPAYCRKATAFRRYCRAFSGAASPFQSHQRRSLQQARRPGQLQAVAPGSAIAKQRGCSWF